MPCAKCGGKDCCGFSLFNPGKKDKETIQHLRNELDNVRAHLRHELLEREYQTNAATSEKYRIRKEVEEWMVELINFCAVYYPYPEPSRIGFLRKRAGGICLGIAEHSEAKRRNTLAKPNPSFPFDTK